MSVKTLLRLTVLLTLLSSCGLFGVHLKVHNPRHAGKYPKFSPATIQLGELTPIRSSFDVTFYDLDILINIQKKELGGWVEIKALALKNIDSIQLDLDPQLQILELRADSRNGEKLNYRRQYAGVFLKLNHPISKGQTFSICIQYEGKPLVARKPPWSGGLVWKKDKLGRPFVGVACESEGSSIWFPCKDHTSDEPDSVHARFSIADTGLFIVSNGQFTGFESRNKIQSYNWKTTYPINLYNITFFIGNYVEIKDTLFRDDSTSLNLSYYVLKQDKIKASIHMPQVKKHIKVYESLYGKYPWENDGYKLVASPYAGQEHQSAIAYGNGYKNDMYGLEDYIMLHETGHEWFGNGVSAADLADVWIQEGITTYGEVLYLEKQYGTNIADMHLWNYKLFIKNKLPLRGPVGRRYFDYHDGDVYTKGAWMLQTLRVNIDNDSVFFNILKTFYSENTYKVTDSEKFIETVNRITGKDYHWFFKQYLDKNRVPTLEYKMQKDGSIYYRWRNTDSDFTKLFISGNWKIANSNNAFKIYPSLQIQRLTPPENAFIQHTYLDIGSSFIAIKKKRKLVKEFKKQGIN